MELNIKDCIQKLEKEHPDLRAKWWIEDQGVFLICALQKSVPESEAMVNLYTVDPVKGIIAGPIPVMQIYGNDRLQKKIEKANMVTHGQKTNDRVQHMYRIRTMAHPMPRENDEIYTDTVLVHYGIKGQKWGVRRFQNDDGTLTAEGKDRYGQGKSLAKENSKADPASTQKLSLREKLNTKTANYAENWQKTMDVDLSKHIDREESKKGDHSQILQEAALTILNPANAIYLAKDGIGTVIAKKRTDAYLKNREVKSEKDPETGLYMKKEGSYDEKSDLAAVNPGFMNMNSNTKNNCMLCTTTYDLRKRGYDVTAQMDSQGYNLHDLKRWYPKVKIENTSRFDDRGVGISQKEYMQRTVSNLTKQGDGARGNIMVLWSQGGAHSIFYEVQNGRVIFKDGQSNKVYTKPEKILSMTMSNSYARLDNVKPDLEWIKKECVR